MVRQEKPAANRDGRERSQSVQSARTTWSDHDRDENHETNTTKNWTCPQNEKQPDDETNCVGLANGPNQTD